MRNELQHHGILGQKWGVRRFQNKDGSLTPEGKKHLSEFRKEYPDEFDEAKRKVIRSGKAKDVRQWASELNMKELEEAVNRAEKDKRLLDIERDSPNMLKKGANFIDKLDKYVNTATKTINTGYKVYDTVNKKK